ncbi:MAG: NUDIX hydrolase [Bacteroidetes bacterium]|nr:NUDIX hydrolase [Bacteroidota bacterium]
MNHKVDKQEMIFRGRVFDIRVDDITYDSGNKGIREVILHNGGAVVLPVKDDGKIVMVKQYRYPFDKFLLELPAGKLEINEDPQVCATRELTEETGYTTQKVTKLGSIYTTPGFCNEELHIYLAEDLTAGDHAREEGEFDMEVFEYPLDEVEKMILDGRIKDSKTIAGVAYYKMRKK